MLLRLLLAFTVIPLVELYLLIRLAQATSLGLTIGLVLLTGVLGSWLARQQGLQVWTRFQGALQEGRMPSRELQEGLMIVFAAALLLTPGILTDAFGFLLLIPVSREWLRRLLALRLRHRVAWKVQHFGRSSAPGAADGRGPEAGSTGGGRTGAGGTED